MTTIFLGGHPNNPHPPVTMPFFVYVSLYLYTHICVSMSLSLCMYLCLCVFVIYFKCSTKTLYSPSSSPSLSLCVWWSRKEVRGELLLISSNTTLTYFLPLKGAEIMFLTVLTFQELLWSDYKLRIMKLLCWFLMLSINIRSLGAGPTVQYPIKLVAVEGPCVFGRPPILRSTSLEE